MPWSNGKGRGTKYGSSHAKQRAAALPFITPATPCVRCGHPLGPEHVIIRGRKVGRWHYDHDEHGSYLGFSHGEPCSYCGRRCNVRAGAQKGARIRNGVKPTARQRKPPAPRSLL